MNQVALRAAGVVARAAGKRALTSLASRGVKRAATAAALNVGKHYFLKRFKGHNKRLRTLRRKFKSSKKKNYKIVVRTGGEKTTNKFIINKRSWKRTKQIRKFFRYGKPILYENVYNGGASWTGSCGIDKVVWVSHDILTTCNVHNYIKKIDEHVEQIRQGNQTSFVDALDSQNYGDTYEYNWTNGPEQAMYIGKCVYEFTVSNPTNYTMNVVIYDLVAKHDFLQPVRKAITIHNEDNEGGESCSFPPIPNPVGCMYTGSNALQLPSTETTVKYEISDTTVDKNPTDNTTQQNITFNQVGKWPSSYYTFNYFWKIKNKKTVQLAPGASVKHNLIINYGKLVTQGSFYYKFANHPNAKALIENSGLVAGLTHSVLFGFYGQVAGDSNEGFSEKVGHLPGRYHLCKRSKEKIYYGVGQSQKVTVTRNDRKKFSETAAEVITEVDVEMPQVGS